MNQKLIASDLKMPEFYAEPMKDRQTCSVCKETAKVKGASSVTPSPTVAWSVRRLTGADTNGTASLSWSRTSREKAVASWPPETSRKARSYSKTSRLSNLP